MPVLNGKEIAVKSTGPTKIWCKRKIPLKKHCHHFIDMKNK